MPYLIQEQRKKLQRVTDAVGCSKLEVAGQLNYLFSAIAKEYIKQQGLSYQACNDVMGALEGAKLEFYRQVVAPYEDKKISSNGALY